LQGFFRLLAQEGSDVSIHDALWAGHQQMYPGWTARHVLRDYFLDGPSESDFMRRVIDRTKTSSKVGFSRHLGGSGNRADREEQAGQQARSPSNRIRGTSKPHRFTPLKNRRTLACS
jgi:hypothetical protein